MLINLANGPNFEGFISALDGQGQGNARFRLLAGQAPPEAAGLAFYFVNVVIDPLSGMLTGWSNRTRVGIKP